MAVCWKCGTTTAEKWRFCSARKEYVCLNCECACENFSRKLLPNGCNCHLTYSPKNYYRALCETKEFERFYKWWEKHSVEQLKARFKLLKERYVNDEQPKQRGIIRAELAALKELLDERREPA